MYTSAFYDVTGPGCAHHFVEDGSGGDVHLHEIGVAKGNVKAGGFVHATASATGRMAKGETHRVRSRFVRRHHRSRSSGIV